jgi:hypothetical protein
MKEVTVSDTVKVETDPPGEVREGLQALALRCWQRAMAEAGNDPSPEAGSAWQSLAQLLDKTAAEADSRLRLASW